MSNQPRVAKVLAALLLFVSVLHHELAHSLVAQARGLTVRSITLFIFGGVSRMEGEAQRPTVEFTVAGCLKMGMIERIYVVK